MRALVIDDDEVYRLLVSHTLTTLGHVVDEAPDGQFGRQLIELSPYDLVVTDIVMPLEDGITVIGLLRDQYPSTRVIAISGGGSNNTDFYLSAARLLGAHAVLAKPFLPAALVIAVTQAFSISGADGEWFAQQHLVPPNGRTAPSLILDRSRITTD